MISAERYEELLTELKSSNLERTAEIIEELGEAEPVYKKSNLPGVYVKVGKLTTRNEIILDVPISDKLDNSQPIVSYEKGWWIQSKGKSRSKGLPSYHYLDSNPNNKIEELCSSDNEFSVLGHVTRLEHNNRLRKIVFYDQYLTGEEHGVVVNTNNRWKSIVLPDGTTTKIPYNPNRR